MKAHHAVAIGCLAAALAACPLPAVAQSPTDTVSVAFEYGIVGRTASRVDSLFAVQDGATLRTGDQIRITVRKRLATFVYVILQMSDGEFALFNLARGEADGDTLESLPWLKLEGTTGVETVHMVASTAPLAGLEETFQLYGEARGAQRAELAADFAARLPPVPEAPQDRGEGLMPLARMGTPAPLAWNYRGPFNEEDKARYLFARCVGDTVAADRVRIIHQ